MTDETAVLDPAEFIDGRTEFGFDKEGIKVVEVDWGDAELEKFYIKQSLGEIPADEHPPNRTVTFKLQAHPYNGKSVANTLIRLQKKVGTLAEKGGWIRRDLNSEQDFAVSVGAIVYNAVLGGIQGWFMSHRGIANEITLVLTVGPYFYSTEEFSTEPVVKNEKHFAEYVREKIRSVVKGLSRIKIKNIGEKPWRAIIWGEECDTAPDDLTDARAKLRYAPSELELIGEAKEYQALLDGGKSALIEGEVGPVYSTVVHSYVKTKGHMIHRGNRRLWVRAWSGGAVGTHTVRIIWRPLGTTRWNESNASVTFSGLTSEKHLLDLGEIRSVAPALGEERIEFMIQVLGGANFVLEDIYVLPLEQYLVLTDSEEASPPTNKQRKTPGTGETKHELEVYNPYNGNKLELMKVGEALLYPESAYYGLFPGSAWTNPGNIKVKDENRAVSVTSLVEGKSTGFGTDWLVGTNFGFALPATAIVASVAVITTERFTKVAGTGVVTMRHALTSLLYKGKGRSSFIRTELLLGTVDAETVTNIEGATLNPAGNPLTGTEVNDATFGVTIAGYMGYTSGTAPEAKYEANVITIGVYYSENESEALCYQERSIELRSEGCYRQHITDEVWGEVVPQGNFPYTPSGGLEDKPSRGIVIPSRGDLTTADEGPQGIEVQAIERPAYQFTPEEGIEEE